METLVDRSKSLAASAAESVFLTYIATKNPQGALLIRGNWGSGKTQLWRNKLSAILPRKMRVPIYISVAGLSSVAELDDALFSAIYPIFDSAGAKVAAAFGRSLLRAVKIEPSDIDLKKLKPDFLADYVFCVDDLERFEGRPQSLFGFLQEIVEQKRAHCVLLCDIEKLISRDTKESSFLYSEILEKLLWREVPLVPDRSNVLDDFVKGIDAPAIRNFMNENSSKILDVFNVAECNNLRTLSYVTRHLASLFLELQNLGVDKNRWPDLVPLVTSSMIEIRANRKNIELVRSVLRPMSFFDAAVRESLEEGSDGVGEFEKKYAPLFPARWPSVPALESFVIDGYVDREAIVSQLSNPTPNNSGLLAQMVQDFFSLDDDQLKEAINQYKSILAQTSEPITIRWAIDREQPFSHGSYMRVFLQIPRIRSPRCTRALLSID